MSVVVRLALPASAFELGRILPVEDDTYLSLETMVPLGERTIPFFRLYDGHDAFEATVREHAAVDDVHAVSAHDGETLYGLDWQIGADAFFGGIMELEGHLLEATGTAETWTFELRFPSHERLSEFREYCVDADLPVSIERVYNPTKPDVGPWYGLTSVQRETLARAVEAGYYSVPRQVSTRDLAEEFGISDQAVIERLRRGISRLVTNTLLLKAASEENS